jgi:hypothetical protein
MAAFNEVPNCSFDVGTKVTSTLVSPSFVLEGVGPYFIELDMIRDFAPWTQSTVLIRFVDQAIVNKIKPVSIEDFEFFDDDGLGLVHRRLQVPQSTKLEGRTIRVEFVAESRSPDIPPAESVRFGGRCECWRGGGDSLSVSLMPDGPRSGGAAVCPGNTVPRC